MPCKARSSCTAPTRSRDPLPGAVARPRAPAQEDPPPAHESPTPSPATPHLTDPEDTPPNANEQARQPIIDSHTEAATTPSPAIGALTHHQDGRRTRRLAARRRPVLRMREQLIHRDRCAAPPDGAERVMPGRGATSRSARPRRGCVRGHPPHHPPDAEPVPARQHYLMCRPALATGGCREHRRREIHADPTGGIGCCASRQRRGTVC